MNVRINRVLTALMSLITLPPTLAHEVTHGVLAAPWADQLALVVDPSGLDAAIGVDWRDSTPDKAKWISAYGPLLLGSVVGIWGALRLLSGGTPRQPTSMLVYGVLAVWWSIYTLPSGEDRDTATGD